METLKMQYITGLELHKSTEIRTSAKQPRRIAAEHPVTNVKLSSEPQQTEEEPEYSEEERALILEVLEQTDGIIIVDE